ncbi:MAG: metallophosphoesterase [Deltaproteobacteria bacterium]|nr:metallophosphoesterase [Deltaproteobacteria bacterium]
MARTCRPKSKPEPEGNGARAGSSSVQVQTWIRKVEDRIASPDMMERSRGELTRKPLERIGRTRCDIILIGMVLLAAAGCGPGGDPGGADNAVPDAPPRPDYRPVVFAVVSDIHLEGGMEDGISRNVAELLAAAGALDPAPELVAITGDLVDLLPEPVDTGPGSKVDALRQLFAAAPVPVEATLGNHDVYTSGDAIFAFTKDPAGRRALWAQELGVAPPSVTEHGGMRFLYLDSTAGPRAPESLGLNGSLGAAQLAWLDAQLSDGVASILFLHHPPGIVLEDGEITLRTVVRDHADTVLAIFVGHIHVWDREEFEGVPVYLTEAGYDGDGIHHVRADPAAGTVEILNAGAIDYGETEVLPCDPDREPGLPDPAALEGTALVLRIPDTHVEPMGLGSYLREVVGEIPLVLRIGGPAPAGDGLEALITAGTWSGDGADGAPAYVKPVTEGSCEGLTLVLDGPCFSTTPVTLLIDIGKVIGIPLPPGWKLRAALKDLVLSGVLTDGAAVEQGVFDATLDFAPGALDLQAIIAREYCKGTLDGCVPGEGAMPACPQDPGPELFADIPVECDVHLLGIGLRMVFDIFESVPGLSVSLDANFSAWPAQIRADPAPGAVAPDLFAEAPMGTCPAP